MSARSLPSPIPSDLGQAVLALTERVRTLTEKVEALESQSGRMMPADYRVSTLPDGSLVIRRVSTGNSAVVTPPL